MANNNVNEIGYSEVLSAGTANALMVQYKRANAAPMDISEVHSSITGATSYASEGATSYAGQVISVVDGTDVSVHKIMADGTLKKLMDEDDIARLLIPENAKEALDTLEEIAAWIQAHPDDASAMAIKIEELKNKSHEHGNKEAIDKITTDDINRWNSFTASTVVQYSLSESQYTELIDKKSVIVNGITIEYDDNTYYAVYADEPQE